MEIKSPQREIEYKPVVKDDGTLVLKRKDKIYSGKKSKSSGGQFELRVRRDLEEKGWIVDKWSNNLDFESGGIIPAKRRFNPFSKVMSIGTGFPDFVAFQKMPSGLFRVVGVEVKVGGKLSRIEKEKCVRYLEMGVFNQILVAKKVKEKNRVRVEYLDFEEIKRKMRKPKQ